ncbi:MAG: nucleotidyltransferase domain-containing protein [Treponema sp.]|nr:nucleotidyltransferase domain-containing protein [Treponema sp.]
MPPERGYHRESRSPSARHRQSKEGVALPSPALLRGPERGCLHCSPFHGLVSRVSLQPRSTYGSVQPGYTVPDCEKIYLFGSYAYGTPHKDSDYDFYVVLNDACTDKTPNVIDRIYHALMYTKGMYVDILSSHKNRFEDRSRLPTLERTVASKGVLLYDRT